MSSVLLFIVILVGLIVAHELGHFLFAKLFKVKVEEFGVGYPPRLAKMFKIGETEYTLNWIPFGGFVKILGETPDEQVPKEEKHRTMQAKPVYAQVLILAGGVIVNALLAVVFFAWAYYLGVPHAVKAPTDTSKVLITSVLPDSPAQEAGIPAGVVIVEISDGKTTIKPKSQDEVIEFIQERKGKTITIKTQKLVTQQEQIYKLKPAQAVLSDAPEKVGIGIAISLIDTNPMPLKEAVVLGFKSAYQYAISIVDMLKELIASIGSGNAKQATENISGPVGIVKIIKDSAEVSVASVLFVVAVISINLAVLNLLPIPALDGGRIFLLLIEAIIRRPLPPSFVQIINAISFFLLIALMIYVTYKDIVKIFG